MTQLEALAQIRKALQFAAELFTDAQALQVTSIYPTWQELCDRSFYAENIGYRFQYGDDLYKTTQPGFTFQSQWVPGIETAGIFTRIDETHAGTAGDPIPYEGNMELCAGLYYIQDDVLYLCTRDTGTAVFNELADLVGLYVEVA